MVGASGRILKSSRRRILLLYIHIYVCVCVYICFFLSKKKYIYLLPDDTRPLSALHACQRATEYDGTVVALVKSREKGVANKKKKKKKKLLLGR